MSTYLIEIGAPHTIAMHIENNNSFRCPLGNGARWQRWTNGNKNIEISVALCVLDLSGKNLHFKQHTSMRPPRWRQHEKYSVPLLVVIGSVWLWINVLCGCVCWWLMLVPADECWRDTYTFNWVKSSRTEDTAKNDGINLALDFLCTSCRHVCFSIFNTHTRLHWLQRTKWVRAKQITGLWIGLLA